jgi:hypothetical protein
MNDPHHQELSELFASDASELVDEAFVERCVTSFRRTERRLLISKLIAVGAVAGVVGLIVPSLDLAAIVPRWLPAAVATLDSTVGRIDRAAAIGIILVLAVRRYVFPPFRFS